MTRINSNSLNQIVLKIPPGVVITSEWLAKNGVSQKLAWWYVHSNWLERVGEKAYKKPNEEIFWPGIAFALQQQLNLPIHVAGKSALVLLGKAHFKSLNNVTTIDLFAEVKTKIPKWVQQDILSSDKIYIYQNKLLRNFEAKDILKKVVNGLNIQLSCPELAILEVLSLIPKHHDFSEAAMLMEELSSLGTALVQSLLERCISIKVKRLFLYFASKYRPLLLKELDLSKIDLGKGKRVIAGGGGYDSIYQISVPIIQGRELTLTYINHYLAREDLLVNSLINDLQESGFNYIQLVEPEKNIGEKYE